MNYCEAKDFAVLRNTDKEFYAPFGAFFNVIFF